MYLYAITDRPETTLPGVTGIGGAELASLAVGDLDVVVSNSASIPPTATPETLWQHERVLEALMKDRTVLPVRFGTRFSGEQAIRAELMSRHEYYVEALERVKGCVEISLRVFSREVKITQPTVEKPATGRDYMASLMAKAASEREERRRAEALAESLINPLVAFATDYEIKVLPSPIQLLNAALLVPAERVNEVHQVARDLAEQYPDLPMVCTGPWPPYSFSSIHSEMNEHTGS